MGSDPGRHFITCQYLAGPESDASHSLIMAQLVARVASLMRIKWAGASTGAKRPLLAVKMRWQQTDSYCRIAGLLD